jgi:hypothetical protein
MALATAVAIGGLAISAGSTVMSFMQAAEQSGIQRKAQADAAKAMAAARKRLEINYAKERGIQKEPFELQRESMLSAGSQLIQAGQESDRGAVATAGKVYMAQNEAQGAIRTAMGQELTDIQKEIIDEESRLRDLNVQLDLGEVEGAQLAARDAQEAKAQYTEAGVKGAADTLQMGLNMVNLYGKGGKGGKGGKDGAGGAGGAGGEKIGQNENRDRRSKSQYDPFNLYKNQDSFGEYT